ncbi:hypothetical protein [Thermoactinomyces sp. DSM 45892]|uniref:hypothetical protein n=1 Tax=Thermoactinomyces sp. DSM 45892 TaxID=1882753 RepID=UPI00089BF45D|nr:hypothetical protein [Thermoactinomyces sp. DSM 45892]SDZ05351.1 hypothetical protein SAMN05444416_11291 [Thermoactinomyces sp. DSM 45892]
MIYTLLIFEGNGRVFDRIDNIFSPEWSTDSDGFFHVSWTNGSLGKFDMDFCLIKSSDLDGMVGNEKGSDVDLGLLKSLDKKSEFRKVDESKDSAAALKAVAELYESLVKKGVI